jgi:DNA-binding protein H-NS
MATLDLSNYNLSELKGLRFGVEKELKERQRQEVTKAREQILAIAQDLGISVMELLSNKVSEKSAKSKKTDDSEIGPRYRNPADASQTWTGRGRKPRWILDVVASGKTLAELKV